MKSRKRKGFMLLELICATTLLVITLLALTKISAMENHVIAFNKKDNPKAYIRQSLFNDIKSAQAIEINNSKSMVIYAADEIISWSISDDELQRNGEPLCHCSGSFEKTNSLVQIILQGDISLEMALLGDTE